MKDFFYKFYKDYKEWIVVILSAVILAILINRFALFKILVPTPSMTPTIKPGDQIFSTRMYDFCEIKRGDILIFNSKELGKELVKRVVGLPGDRVDIKSDGSVYINRKKLDETYVKYQGGKVNLVFKVPEGKYLMLGDNRNNSDDARYWKDSYIDRKDIHGKTQLRVWPLSRIGVVN